MTEFLHGIYTYVMPVAVGVLMYVSLKNLLNWYSKFLLRRASIKGMRQRSKALNMHTLQNVRFHTPSLEEHPAPVYFQLIESRYEFVDPKIWIADNSVVFRMVRQGESLDTVEGNNYPAEIVRHTYATGGFIHGAVRLNGEPLSMGIRMNDDGSLREVSVDEAREIVFSDTRADMQARRVAEPVNRIEPGREIPVSIGFMRVPFEDVDQGHYAVRVGAGLDGWEQAQSVNNSLPREVTWQVRIVPGSLTHSGIEVRDALLAAGLDVVGVRRVDTPQAEQTPVQVNSGQENIARKRMLDME